MFGRSLHDRGDGWPGLPGAASRGGLVNVLVNGSFDFCAAVRHRWPNQFEAGKGQRMEFGMFYEFPVRPGHTEADAFSEGLDLVDDAERLGLDAAWLSESHVAPGRSVLASPMVIASAIASRTKRMRVGLAVQVLPLGNPLRIAEEGATGDQISRGRLVFGVGRSGNQRAYDAYGIPYGESRERFAEALEIILKAWTQPKLS